MHLVASLLGSLLLLCLATRPESGSDILAGLGIRVQGTEGKRAANQQLDGYFSKSQTWQSCTCAWIDSELGPLMRTVQDVCASRCHTPRADEYYMSAA